MPAVQVVVYNRVPPLAAAILGAFAMKSDSPRHCLECGKLIVHRRITAFYCSGKCREIHNAQRRRLAREEAKITLPPTHTPEADDII